MFKADSNFQSKEHYKPTKYSLTIPHESEEFNGVLHEEQSTIRVIDQLKQQLAGLIKLNDFNRTTFSSEELEKEIQNHLKKSHSNAENYGNWFHYPWLNALVHLLPEKEFVQLRTSRNKLKITEEEHLLMQNKKIGVIGLSVGNSVALNIVMERLCGEIRIADFDELELSNLNRLRSGITELGQNKTIIAARQIAEIDPYIDVKVFPGGITASNIEQFITEGGNLDLIIEVCDDIKVKFLARELAKQYKIPVLMDTNDRGMIDIERFDLEPNRPIFHGKVNGLNSKDLDQLTPEQRLKLVKKIVDFEDLSERMKLSFDEIGKTLISWPQLASGVNLGAALTADLCKRIMLGQHTTSGRYNVDFDLVFG